MSESAVEHVTAPAHHAAAESHHPTAVQYLVVAGILTVLTVCEIGVYYIPALQSVLVPLLLILSAGKFYLVAAYYMHLHFDSRIFSGLFFFPLTLAALILISLTLLLGFLAHHPGP
ncbi:MAG TPA: cytochrome C oxidase subunit IV family protein [Candidatus Binataceae bacterium]|nr:cytochrome C oxidase subunit IV family protein [Candidatus Binataceae bacterium]